MYRWNRVGIPLWKYATSTAKNATQQQELPSLTSFASRHLSIRTILKGSCSEGSHLRDLNRAGQHAMVVQEFESGAVQATEESMGEYVKALVKLDRLDNSRLVQTIQKGAEASMAAPAMQHHHQQYFAPGAIPQAAYMAPASYMAPAMGMAAQHAANSPGTAGNPLIVSSTEPGFFTQMARLFKTLGLAFILVTAGSALIEDRSLSKGFASKGLSSNPDLKPQFANNTKFADVMGVDEAKSELQEIVQYLRDPSKFTSLGGKLPKGVLLAGPPGTGKTMLARAIAGEAGVPFFYCSGSEFEEMYVGVGARRVRDLFAAAKKHSPCIIFMDEIDAIGGHRNPNDQQHMRMTLNQLLVELDGFTQSEGVIVVAATNFPEALDKALVRPGRFDRHVMVPAPDVEGRRQILETHCKTIPMDQHVDMQVVARATPGFSGADLANLINVAALHAAKEDHRAVDMQDLEYAIDRIMMGAERKTAVISERNRRLTAYHEGGHALVAMFTEGADPVHKATIIPRGVALGMVTQLPEEDQLGYSRKQMLARLDVCMGGRVAEELIFGHDDVTTGASSDLKQATQLARAMVTQYGMSEKIGQVCLDYDDKGSMSSETRARVEEEVRLMVQAAYSRAMHILQMHMEDLHSLAAALLERETLTGEQITEALKVSKQQKAQAAAAAAAAAVQTATQEAQAAAAAPAVQEVPVVAMPMPTMAMSAQSPAIKAGGASSR